MPFQNQINTGKIQAQLLNQASRLKMQNLSLLRDDLHVDSSSQRNIKKPSADSNLETKLDLHIAKGNMSSVVDHNLARIVVTNGDKL